MLEYTLTLSTTVSSPIFVHTYTIRTLTTITLYTNHFNLTFFSLSLSLLPASSPFPKTKNEKRKTKKNWRVNTLSNTHLECKAYSFYSTLLYLDSNIRGEEYC